MKLSEIKKHLNTVELVNFELENGTPVPEHFHVTEVGVVTKKNFILLSKQTNCLAQDKCGIPADKLKLNLEDVQNLNQNSCIPGGGCC